MYPGRPWRHPVLTLLTLLLAATELAAQKPVPPITPAAHRLSSYEEAAMMRCESPFKNIAFRSIGPTVMGGRIVDVDVSPDDPTHFYVAYASGGLWKTTSNGTSFEPVFEGQTGLTIGDIAVAWGDPEVIYVGTGENNSSRSSYAGTGVYKSVDGGSTWHHLGLEETHHIGRILIHPDERETIFVAAIGHLYSSNPERGIFKSTDGGETWRQSLAIDDSTGVIDLVMDPTDASVLYAAAWHRARMAWDFKESGKTSGIYKSKDGGETWQLISTPKSGFPTGRVVGRIGLAIAPSDASVIYAVVDNQGIREEKDDDLPSLTFEQLEEMDAEKFLQKVSDKDLKEYLEHHEFPDRYDVETVKSMMQRNEIAPEDLVTFISDANRALFETPVVGCEVYRSNDAGATWWRTHREHLDDMCHTYGYYFGQIRVAPTDPDRVYVAGVPLIRSKDGGETWENIGRDNVHVDHHAIWLNPNRPGQILSGNDGGANLSYDDGETWFKLNTPSVGQFYTVNYDDAQPYNVYGGLQDNGVWVGPSTYEGATKWHGEGRYPYDRLLGGDGMMVEIDPRDRNVVYAGYQFGYYFRIDRADEEKTKIRPSHDLGEEPLRFNWQTPIHLSRHNADILYLGSNKVHRSLDRGDNWDVISDDLTGGKKEGDVPYGTLTALVESPLRFGLVYAGSDDGMIHVSKDGGATWQRIDHGLPERMWVSRIEPSNHEESRVFLSMNGYRWDNMEPMIYVSDDYGERWERIGKNLPLGPVNVIREDPHDADLIYVGSDNGTFVSRDRGSTFVSLGSGMPVAPVHDLRIQPRDRDLIVATHGRSLYVADVSKLEDLNDEIVESDLFVFQPDSVEFKDDWGDRPNAWKDPVEPEVEIAFWAGHAGTGWMYVFDEYDHVMAELEFEADEGLNFVQYDLSTSQKALDKHYSALKTAAIEAKEDLDGFEELDFQLRDNGMIYLSPGAYEIKVKLNGAVQRTQLHINE